MLTSGAYGLVRCLSLCLGETFAIAAYRSVWPSSASFKGPTKGVSVNQAAALTPNYVENPIGEAFLLLFLLTDDCKFTERPHYHPIGPQKDRLGALAFVVVAY